MPTAQCMFIHFPELVSVYNNYPLIILSFPQYQSPLSCHWSMTWCTFPFDIKKIHQNPSRVTNTTSRGFELIIIYGFKYYEENQTFGLHYSSTCNLICLLWNKDESILPSFMTLIHHLSWLLHKSLVELVIYLSASLIICLIGCLP